MSKDTEIFLNMLKNKGDKVFIAQIAPAVRVSIGEYLGYDAGTNVIGELITALKKAGFDYVFDTNFGADLTIIEEANELIERIKGNKVLPMFTTCCPTWYTFVEKLYPTLIPHLSTVKSPQSILGSLVKTYIADKLKIDKKNIYHIAIAPCLIKKEEAKDIDYWVFVEEGIPNIDLVLTTTEMSEILKTLNINLKTLERSEFDNPLGQSSGAGAIFGTTGGVMEAVLRTAYYLYTGEDFSDIELTDIRNAYRKKEGIIKFANLDLNIAMYNDLGQVKPMLDLLKETGKVPFHFVEVMNCPGGCIGGFGQAVQNPRILQKRREALFKYDQEHIERLAHHNPGIKMINDEFLESHGSEKAKRCLHINRKDKSDEDSLNFVCTI